jgi:mutator protein MutT
MTRSHRTRNYDAMDVHVVGAAIVRDGRVLAARRSAPHPLAGGWEFPGGKVEPGESEADALVRECQEELGVTVAVTERLGQARAEPIVLTLYAAELAAGAPAPLVDHDELRWVLAAELDSLAWLPIDRELLPAVRKRLVGDAGAMLFRATLDLHGKTATGIEVPDEVVDKLGAGKRPPVSVTIGGYTFRTTVAQMGGRYLVGVSAEHRAGAGVQAGDTLDVEIELDGAPREVTMPADLEQALAGEAEARRHFEGLSFTHRKEWVRWIEEAKKPETRATRVAKTVEALRAGRRAR